MPLPILRLPFLALRLVVSLMSNVSLVGVSLQSRRADYVLKKCGKQNVSFFNLDVDEINSIRSSDQLELFLLETARRQSLREWPVTLSVSVKEEFTLGIDKDELDFFHLEVHFESLQDINEIGGHRKELKIGDRFVPTIVSEDRCDIYTFWEDKTDGLIFVTEYFSKHFHVELDQVSIDTSESATSSADLRKFVDSWAQATVQNVSVELVADEDYKYILRNLSATDQFDAHSETKRNFKFSGMIQAKSISIENGHWFTQRHLMNSVNYKEILMSEKKFSKAILIRFLEKWVAGKYPKLKKLRVGTFMKDSLSFLRHFEFYSRPIRGIQRHRIYTFKGPGQKYAVAMSLRPNRLEITIGEDRIQ
ncbi:unnamed protein product [Caenorhabditis brenneri]